GGAAALTKAGAAGSLSSDQASSINARASHPGHPHSASERNLRSSASSLSGRSRLPAACGTYFSIFAPPLKLATASLRADAFFPDDPAPARHLGADERAEFLRRI